MSKEKMSDKEVANTKSERIMNTVAKRCSFYRANPNRFAKEYLNLNLKPFQQVLLYLMVRCTGFCWIAARGLGKSFLTAVFCVITCILWPGQLRPSRTEMYVKNSLNCWEPLRAILLQHNNEIRVGVKVKKYIDWEISSQASNRGRFNDYLIVR